MVLEFGIFVLFQFIYKNADYQKPFFSTYLKTSMFTIYLFGLCFWPQWRAQLYKPPVYQVLFFLSLLNTIPSCLKFYNTTTPITYFQLLDPIADEESFYTEATSSLVCTQKQNLLKEKQVIACCGCLF